MKTQTTETGLSLIQAQSEPSAQAAYQAHQANIAIILAALHDRLTAHAARATADPTNWGFADDLGAIQGRLLEAAEFMPPLR